MKQELTACILYQAVFVSATVAVNVTWSSSTTSDQGDTVAVPFVTIVPLGLPALSVSILTHKSTQGLTYFLNASFNVLPATPLPKAGILTLVSSAVSPIAWTWSALANVTISSTNTLSQASASSHRIYVSRSTMLSANPLLTKVVTSVFNAFCTVLLLVM